MFEVSSLPESAIVDTNGAGDMFAGGYLGAVVLGKSTDEAVEAGHKLGAMCVGQVRFDFFFQLFLALISLPQIGPQLKYPKQSIL
jgi:adenosine kinase